MTLSPHTAASCRHASRHAHAHTHSRHSHPHIHSRHSHAHAHAGHSHAHPHAATTTTSFATTTFPSTCQQSASAGKEGTNKRTSLLLSLSSSNQTWQWTPHSLTTLKPPSTFVFLAIFIFDPPLPGLSCPLSSSMGAVVVLSHLHLTSGLTQLKCSRSSRGTGYHELNPVAHWNNLQAKRPPPFLPFPLPPIPSGVGGWAQSW